MKYRRRIKSDCWHFIRACRWWPKTAFKASDKPKPGELCDECRSKAKDGLR